MTRPMTLQEIYQSNIEEYKKTGTHPHPSALLALLLFQEIDKYRTFIAADDEFYDQHKIVDKIKQVIHDFNISKEEILKNDKSSISIEDFTDDYYYGSYTFSSGLCSLKHAIMRDANLSPEELFIHYARIYHWFNLPDNIEIKKLGDLYEQYKHEFNITAQHPHPAELLSLLLLQEKERYYLTEGNLGNFYQYYKKSIDKKIEQVIIDFAISKEEIIAYIKQKGVYYKEENYERDKIWHVFSPGFEVVQWGNARHKDASPEKLHNAYSFYWGRETLPDFLFGKEEKTPKRPYTKGRKRQPRQFIATRGFK